MQNIHYIHNAKHSLIIHKIEFTNAHKIKHIKCYLNTKNYIFELCNINAINRSMKSYWLFVRYIEKQGKTWLKGCIMGFE